ncbi:MAG: ABC transporter ATP-binding protein [Caldilineaceae bacterium]
MKISVQQYWELLAKYLQSQRGQVIGLAVLLLSNIVLQLLNPQIMRRFLDLATAGEAMETLTPLAILFIGVALVQQLAAVGVTYVGETIAWAATNLLRYDLARHCLYLDMAFHNEHLPGEMIERIDGDVNALSQFFSQFVLQVLGNALLLIGVVVLLFREATSIGVAMTLFVLLTLVLLNRLRNTGVPYWQQSRAASADYFGFIEERLAGTEDIRASGATSYVLRGFVERLRDFWRTTLRARLISSAMMNIAWVAFSIGTTIAFVMGAALYQRSLLTLGAVYLIVHYTTMLSMPMQRIMQEIEKLQQAGAGVARIRELLAIQSTLTKPATAIATLPAGPLAVAFDRVAFAYPGATEDGQPPERVLHDLSFTLPPGQVLGLLGRTGSGKTTVARLLTRFYDPSDGTVLLGGVDLRTLDPGALRTRVGVVTQNIQLFHATVRDNLTFFDPSIPDETLHAVVEELGLLRWYKSLEQGLDTLLAADGSGLSAGEAQLLAFARVFLKDPGLVILDEASSRLDPATEQFIERAVDRLLHNRTAIIIAHRLATVQRADEILILEHGQIREQGKREALAADPASRFHHLLQHGVEELLA